MTDKIDLETLAASGFTPGPWRQQYEEGEIFITADDGCDQIAAYVWLDSNANLIAAPPTLLQIARDERARADEAEAEVKRLREAFRGVGQLSRSCQLDKRDGLVVAIQIIHETSQSALNGESNE